MSTSPFTRTLNTQHQPPRILNVVLNLNQKRDCLFPIEQPVVVCKCHHHDGADLDLPVDGDGLLLNRMQTEHRCLREVDDGSSEQRASGC